MKKIINDVSQVEQEMIQGLVKAHPQYLRRVTDSDVLARARRKQVR